jgi:hypothetical protein
MIIRLCSTILSGKRRIICALPDRHKALQEIGRDGGTAEWKPKTRKLWPCHIAPRHLCYSSWDSSSCWDSSSDPSSCLFCLFLQLHVFPWCNAGEAEGRLGRRDRRRRRRRRFRELRASRLASLNFRVSKISSIPSVCPQNNPQETGWPTTQCVRESPFESAPIKLF